jgi:hypothetical protein
MMIDNPVRYSLWDLDNCLTDEKWRTPLIDWHLDGNERYNRYDEQMYKDAPANLGTWHLITQLSHPIFVTGRRERWRELTVSWIKRNLRAGGTQYLHKPAVFMRPNDNSMRPVELKRMILLEFILPSIPAGKIIAAFDDVPSIVQMYRDYDIPAMVLRCHDPALSYKPEDL